MCLPNMEYQSVNPTTQVALYAQCIGNCINIKNITWNIYQGHTNVSSNISRWSLFTQMNIYKDIWFFGKQNFFIFFILEIIDYRFKYK